MGINGFGRIGRSVLRAALLRDDVEIVGINDPLAGDAQGNVTQQGVEYLAYLLKYDSTHGILDADVEVYNNKIILNGRPIRITAQKDPAKLCWYEIGVSVVIEATGLFLSTSKAFAHVDAGAYKVVITGPVKDETPMFVMGVNENTYQGDEVVSNASCTTNALAPIVKIIQDHYGIESALMTTVHSYTASQKTVDGPSAKDWRGGRGAAQNIIPSTTGAAKAVGKVVPELDGKITGISMRVPTPDVSLVDVTINLSTAADYEQICETIRKEAEGAYKGIVAYVDDAVVSSDILGGTAISYFDAQAGLSVNDKLVKLVAWYDNEVGYSNKVLDLAKHVILHP
ncbi:MAG: type I glyceraldehyde-3-phosphate dehydrogenase [Succinivibrionaceae bacterium]|nr:type I glyceraldehyde-3-phosphate dehydrogenase [Succinivibrionaceae bacterium]